MHPFLYQFNSSHMRQYSVWLETGCLGFNPWQRQRPNWLQGPPSLLSSGYWVYFPQEYSTAWVWCWPLHSHVVLKSRMSRSCTSFPLSPHLVPRSRMSTSYTASAPSTYMVHSRTALVYASLQSVCLKSILILSSYLCLPNSCSQKNPNNFKITFESTLIY
jgi:hypothetical protein